MHAAAGLLPSIAEPTDRDAALGEGPRWEIVVSSGVIRLRRHRADEDRAVHGSPGRTYRCHGQVRWS